MIYRVKKNSKRLVVNLTLCLLLHWKLRFCFPHQCRLLVHRHHQSKHRIKYMKNYKCFELEGQPDTYLIKLKNIGIFIPWTKVLISIKIWNTWNVKNRWNSKICLKALNYFLPLIFGQLPKLGTGAYEMWNMLKLKIKTLLWYFIAKFIFFWKREIFRLTLYFSLYD